MLVVSVVKIQADLSPHAHKKFQGFVPAFLRRIISLAIMNVGFFGIVVVGVQNHVKSLANRPVHNLFYSRHPFGIHCVIFVRKMIVPRDRKPYRTDSVRRKKFEHVLSCLGLSP